MSLAMQRTSVRKPNIERTFDKLASFAKTTGLWKKRGRVFCKDGRDVVADADINIEKKITAIIRRDFPGHDILTEESRYQETGSEYLWVVDPIDGTVNFTKEYPIYSISVGLMKGGMPLRGFVYVPPLQKFYSAIAGQGAFCNGKKIHVSKTKEIGSVLLSVMLTSHYDESENERSLDIIRRANMKARGVRIVVCESAELCFVAQGILDANVVCVKADLFGAVAGQLILQEAGGKLTDLAGHVFGANSSSILATNTWLHSALISLFGDLQQP